jgi:hypothetical protein
MLRLLRDQSDVRVVLLDGEDSLRDLRSGIKLMPFCDNTLAVMPPSAHARTWSASPQPCALSERLVWLDVRGTLRRHRSAAARPRGAALRYLVPGVEAYIERHQLYLDET